MRRLIALIIIISLSGCTTVPTQPKQEAKLSPEQYYSEAREAQASGDYSGAIKYSSELEKNYPLSPYSQLVPLETAFARYKLKEYDNAAIDAERFITSYPLHANVDYAYYLKGLIRSAQGSGTSIENPSKMVIVDPNYSRDAYNNFSILVTRFPDSKYRTSALERMYDLRNQMASHELQAVETKIGKGDLEGAIHLAKYISEQYPNTPAATEALELITKASSTSIYMNSPRVKVMPVEQSVEAIPEAEPNIEATLVAPSVEVMPALQPIAPALANETMHREAWLLQQNPKHFTLQIASSGDKNKLENYIKQHKLEKYSAYFRRKMNNKDWYSLLYGNYESRTAAMKAAEEIKLELGISDIWIRQFNDVQASIVQDRSDN